MICAVGSARTSEVTSVEGEASVSNRKGKLIFFYEFALKVKWTGMFVDHEVVAPHFVFRSILMFTCCAI